MAGFGVCSVEPTDSATGDLAASAENSTYDLYDGKTGVFYCWKPSSLKVCDVCAFRLNTGVAVK
jgi:hypothetical protein